MSYQTLEWRTLQKIILNTLKESVNNRLALGLSRPKLCVVLVGNNWASLTYIAGKRRACEEIGFDFELKQYDSDITEVALVSAIETINKDTSTHGCIVQLPLPPQIPAIRIINAIDPNKDVDGFTRANIGNLFLGQLGLESCTPQGIMRLLSYHNINPTGKHVVIIGRSAIVGRPLSLMLMHAGATVTLCHSQTQNLQTHTRMADIIVVAIGKSQFLTANMVREGSIVIDVGLNRNTENKLTGDVDFDEIIKKAHCSPVPGGVGPMTIAMLLENTMRACEISD